MRINYDDPNAAKEIAAELGYLATLSMPVDAKLCVVGVGHAPTMSDGLGPYVGTRLKAILGDQVTVIGTMEDWVGAGRVGEVAVALQAVGEVYWTIAVDAAVGQQIGRLGVYDEPLRPGAGQGKSLASLGDVSIMGCTGLSGLDVLLDRCDPDIVRRMGDVVVEGIVDFVARLDGIRMEAISA
jgi:putative sporulation protein YyaC